MLRRRFSIEEDERREREVDRTISYERLAGIDSKNRGKLLKKGSPRRETSSAEKGSPPNSACPYTHRIIIMLSVQQAVIPQMPDGRCGGPAPWQTRMISSRG